MTVALKTADFLIGKGEAVASIPGAILGATTDNEDSGWRTSALMLTGVAGAIVTITPALVGLTMVCAGKLLRRFSADSLNHG